MTITGTTYGVVLNDRAELAELGPALSAKPYLAPPKAPVVYIKPGPCLTYAGAPIPVPLGCDGLELSPTLALLFGANNVPVAAGLALDVSLPATGYYRPDIARRARDGFLPLARFVPLHLPLHLPGELVTFIDGIEAHRWPLARLLRQPSELIADLSTFMTLRPGDALLIGLPGDAPTARAGQTVRVEAKGLPSLTTVLTPEAA